jgi:hypothetical protein
VTIRPLEPDGFFQWGYPMRLVDAGITVKDRILLHLLDYWGQMHQGIWPEVLTQDGIASVVGISRSHVAVTLPDLISEQLVEPHVERVRDRPRRVKVYSLSYKGGMTAGALVQRLLPATVTAMDDSGEWEIPLDGLIQVHRVHMLTAFRLLDEENRIDLNKSKELSEPKKRAEEPPKEEGEMEPSEVEEVEWEERDEVEDLTPSEAPVETTPAGHAREVPEVQASAPGPPPAPTQAAYQAPSAGPTDVLQGRPVPPEVLADGQQVRQPVGVPSQGWPQQPGPAIRQPPPGGQRPHPGPAPGQYGTFWSPLRFGSGFRPNPGYAKTLLVMGFLTLLGAAVFFGLQPIACSVIWVPLFVTGALFSLFGFKSSWALGPHRETWVAGALSSYAFVAITALSFILFGYEAAIDLAWLGLILGFPVMVLAVGTPESQARRASFALLMGPVMMIAAITLSVLDPESFGRTGALPLLVVTVGASWAFVGWVMTRTLEDGRVTAPIFAGGAIGLGLAALAGGLTMASDGDLTLTTAVAVVLWVVGAAYVAVVSLVPSLEALRPDSSLIYSGLAVAGSAGLITASAIFLMGGFYLIGGLELLIGVGMVVTVAPELRKGGTGAYILYAMGSLVALASVLAVSVTL